MVSVAVLACVIGRDGAEGVRAEAGAYGDDERLGAAAEVGGDVCGHECIGAGVQRYSIDLALV